MSENLTSQQERFSVPDSSVPEEIFVQPEKISDYFISVEQNYFARLNSFLSAADLAEVERARKLKDLDKISEDYFPCKISELPYYFPRESQCAVRKTNYREVGSYSPFFTKQPILSLQCLPNGRIFSSSRNDCNLSHFDAKDGNWVSDDNRVNLSFFQALPNLNIGILAYHKIKILDQESHQLVAENVNSLQLLQFLPNGKVVFCEQDALIVCELDDPKSENKSWHEDYMYGLESPATSLNVAIDGSICWCDEQRNIYMLRTTDGESEPELVAEGLLPYAFKKIFHHSYHNNQISGLMTPKSAFATLTFKDGEWEKRIALGQLGIVNDFQSLLDGRVAVARGEQSIGFLEKSKISPLDGREYRNYTKIANDDEVEFTSIAVFPDGKVVAGLGDGTVRVYDGELDEEEDG